MAITQTEMGRVQKGQREWLHVAVPCFLSFWFGAGLSHLYDVTGQEQPRPVASVSVQTGMNDYEKLIHGYYQSDGARLLLQNGGRYRLVSSDPLHIERGEWRATASQLTLTPSGGKARTAPYSFTDRGAWKIIETAGARYVEVDLAPPE